MGEQNICAPDQLWVPGLHLDNDYPTPTASELAKMWEEYSQEDSIALQSVYGALTPPQAPVKAIASIDICEVLRQTAQSFDLVLGKQPTNRNIYAKGTWFYPELERSDYEKSVVVSVVRAVMNAGLVEPMPDAHVAADYMKHWRANGVYVVANTSTLPGCEAGTIRDFGGAYKLKDCFDGLLLPRNHDGSGSMTKAKALRVALHEVHIDTNQIPIVHIDDSLSHIDGFTAEYSNHDALGLYVPMHEDNGHAPEHQLAESTADAFTKAHEFYKTYGVVS